jgi:hypothetical protein
LPKACKEGTRALEDASEEERKKIEDAWERERGNRRALLKK